MIQTNKKLDIDTDDIFANDLLDRREAIEDLSQLIEDQEEPLVLSVNADWGAGKTTFVQLWQAYLKTQDIESIYFSAWESDFSDEPLVAILGELNIYIEKSSKKLTLKQKLNVKEKLKEITTKTLPAVVGAVAGDMAGKVATALIDNYQTNKDDLQKLKESITKILKTINPKKPFVIFIDELDRCKPLYAIELLERIKHIFDINQLIFVLSIDKDNLVKSIQSQYGNIDTDNYLRRFIHLEYSLKNPSVDKFCKVLFERFDLVNILNSKNIRDNHIYDLNLIQKLSIDFGLSLRQIEQIFIKLNIFFKTMPPRFYQSHFTVFILFECLKSHDKQLYDDFLAGDSTAQKKIQGIVFSKLDRNVSYKYIKAIILATPLRNDPEACEKLIDTQDFANISSHDHHNLRNTINTTIKHIDFTEKFNFSTEEKN